MVRRAITDEERQRVIELKRQYSFTEVAEMTGLPLGTVRTIVRRSGAFTDNLKHRLMFTLPAIKHSARTQLAAFMMPVQREVIGDKEIDAVLWLREVISTGDGLAIDTALKAAANIKTPLADIEKRYSDHLIKHCNGNVFSTFASIGFANLKGLAERSVATAVLKAESVARFGNDPDLMTEAERFCIRTLDGIDVALMNSNRTLIADRFKQHFELMPHTLDDCLYELRFWSELYCLKQAANGGEPASEAYEREGFVFDLMANIRSRSRDEAASVLKYIIDHERKDDRSTDAILFNLVS